MCCDLRDAFQQRLCCWNRNEGNSCSEGDNSDLSVRGFVEIGVTLVSVDLNDLGVVVEKHLGNRDGVTYAACELVCVGCFGVVCRC